MRFKILVGFHQHKDPVTGAIHEYNAKDPKNNIITCDVNLVKSFGRAKFMRLEDKPGVDDEEHPDSGEGGSEQPETDAYEGMSYDELKKVAKSENIDISGCKTKADLIKAINAAMVA